MDEQAALSILSISIRICLSYLVSVYLIKMIRQRHLVGDEKTKKRKSNPLREQTTMGTPQVWTSALHASLENSDRCERKELKKKKKKRKEQTTAVASSSFSNWKQRRNTHSDGRVVAKVAKCIYIHQVVDDTTILYYTICVCVYFFFFFFYINIIRTASERKMERRECYRLQQHHLKSQEIHFPFIYHNGERRGWGERKEGNHNN